ncbi:MAG: hypothetical protein AAF957_07035 [Planctomycetota bacterium]
MRGVLPILFVALALGAAAFASKRAIERPPGPDGVDGLTLLHALERERSVRLDGWNDTDARRLAGAWTARGLTASAEGALRVVRLEPTDPRASGLLASAGAKPVEDAGAGAAWTLDGDARIDLVNDCVVVTRDDPARSGVPATFVIATEGTATLADAVESLARRLPPTQPRLVVHRERAPRLTVDLRANGVRGSRPTRIGPPRLETTFDEVDVDGVRVRVENNDVEGATTRALEVAQGIARAARDEPARLGLDPSLADGLEVRLLVAVDERARTGPVDAPAWVVAPSTGESSGPRLVGIAGVAGLEREALRAWRGWLLHAAYGPPAAGWIADGLAHGALRADDASLWSGVTFEEATGGSPRTHAVRAVAAAHLVDLALESAPDRAAAARSLWRDGVEGPALGSLRQRWDAALLEAARGSTQDAPPELRRPLPRAVAARLAGAASPPIGLGTRNARAEMERVKELGFGAVALNVHVPIAPPAAFDPRRSITLGGWGARVTTQGDGAVLAAARHAAELGLEVVLWPRFVAGESGPLATQQIHPDAAAFTALGRRYALAVEGVAHLAERAGASAIVLLEHPLLPQSNPLPEDIVDARASLRRQAVAFARPFRGSLVLLARGVPRLERAAARPELSAARAPGVVFGFHLGHLGADVANPSAAYTHRLRSAAAAADGRLRAVEVALPGDDPLLRQGLLRGAQDAIAAVEGVDLVLVSYWGLGLRDAESRTSFDLRGEDPGLLRDLTAVRSSGR